MFNTHSEIANCGCITMTTAPTPPSTTATRHSSSSKRSDWLLCNAYSNTRTPPIPYHRPATNTLYRRPVHNYNVDRKRSMNWNELNGSELNWLLLLTECLGEVLHNQLRRIKSVHRSLHSVHWSSAGDIIMHHMLSWIKITFTARDG